MNVREISNYVWQHSVTIEFGAHEHWNPDQFLVRGRWTEDDDLRTLWAGMNLEGWYWFCARTTYPNMAQVQTPDQLPGGACDFGATTQAILETFGDTFVCQPSDDGWLVLYNGHEKSVRNRVRSHYAVKNHLTGALGIIHYPLSNWEWRVHMFTRNQIEPGLAATDRERIEQLLQSKAGRCSVESAWRVGNGWPVLCKE